RLGFGVADLAGRIPAGQLAGFAGRAQLAVERQDRVRALRLRGGTRVGHDPEDPAADLRWRGRERDLVAVALAHLPPVDPGNRHDALIDGRLGHYEHRPVHPVESHRQVPGDLDVLPLITAD